MARKTYQEKLNDVKDLPKVEVIGDDNKMAARFGDGKMLIASPLEYDALMKQVPEGKVITSDELRGYLAGRHDADFTCQLTAGIFINIAAHASRERQTAGQGDPTPYWRTLKKGGELNEKYPDGIDGQKLLLEMEGVEVIQKGKRYFVKDYEKRLHTLK